MDSQKPLRVLHYSSWKVPCGIADYTEDLLQGLAANGVVNEMVPNDFSQNRSMSYADLHRQQDDLIRRAADFDVVHVQHEYSFFGRTVAESNPEFTRFLDQFLKQTNKPMLVTFHENPPPLPPAQTDFGIKSRLKRAVKGALHFALDLVSKPRERQNGDYGKVFTAHRDRLCALVHTGATRQLVVGQGLPDDRVLVIPMGVKVRSARVNMDQAEARRLLGLPADCKLVSQFGFITARKGPHIAALALKQLPPEYRLVFIGGLHPLSYEGILGEIFKIWEGEDPDRIHITDHLPTEEVDVWQAASDVCLAPYLDAHSGSAGITWSLTSGRPVIASKTATFRELNAQSNAMLMVMPNCPYELAWQIRRVTTNPKLAAEMVARARHYSDEYSWPRTGQRHIDLYRRFLPGATSEAVPQRRAA